LIITMTKSMILVIYIYEFIHVHIYAQSNGYVHIYTFVIPVRVSFWRSFDPGVALTWRTPLCLWNLGVALIWASLLFLCVVWMSLDLGVTWVSL
jgi:hypothetical protein